MLIDQSIRLEGLRHTNWLQAERPAGCDKQTKSHYQYDTHCRIITDIHTPPISCRNVPESRFEPNGNFREPA